MSNRKETAEQQILDAIREYQNRAYGPSRRDLHKMTGIGLGTCQGIVTRLAEEGRIEYQPGIARSIRIKETT